MISDKLVVAKVLKTTGKDVMRVELVRKYKFLGITLKTVTFEGYRNSNWGSMWHSNNPNEFISINEDDMLNKYANDYKNRPIKCYLGVE